MISGILILTIGYLNMENFPISYDNEFSSNFFVFTIGFVLLNIGLFILIRFILTPKVKKQAIKEGRIPKNF